MRAFQLLAILSVVFFPVSAEIRTPKRADASGNYLKPRIDANVRDTEGKSGFGSALHD